MDTLKKEAVMIREESSKIVDCSSNWKKSFPKHKAEIAKALRSKISLLQELQSQLDQLEV